MKRIIAALAALFAALALVLIAPPAQAYGWSGQNCMTQAGNGARVCVQVHTVPRGSGMRIDQIQLCAYKVDNVYGNRFQGAKTVNVEVRGSGGALLGYVPLWDTGGASYAGVCSYTNTVVDGGNGASFAATGKLILKTFPDASFSIGWAGVS